MIDPNRRAVLTGAAGIALVTAASAAAAALPADVTPADDPDARLVALWRELAEVQVERDHLSAEADELLATLPPWAQNDFPVFTKEEAAALGLAPDRAYSKNELEREDLIDFTNSALEFAGRKSAPPILLGERVKAAAQEERADRLAAWNSRRAEMDRLREEAGVAELERRCAALIDRETEIEDEIRRTPAAGPAGLLVKMRDIQRVMVHSEFAPDSPPILGLIADLRRLSPTLVPPIASHHSDDTSTWDDPPQLPAA